MNPRQAAKAVSFGTRFGTNPNKFANEHVVTFARGDRVLVRSASKRAHRRAKTARLGTVLGAALEGADPTSWAKGVSYRVRLDGEKHAREYPAALVARATFIDEIARIPLPLEPAP